MPPHNLDYDAMIMKCLNDNPIVHMTVTELRHRTKMNPTTLWRHLNKMEERHIVIRYGPELLKLDRRNNPDPRFPTFYRLNPEMDGEVKFCMWRPGKPRPQPYVNPKSKSSRYRRMQINRRRGKVVYYTITQGMLRGKRLLPADSHIDSH